MNLWHLVLRWIQQNTNEKDWDAWALVADAAALGAAARMIFIDPSWSDLWLLDLAAIVTGGILGHKMRKYSKALSKKKLTSGKNWLRRDMMS